MIINIINIKKIVISIFIASLILVGSLYSDRFSLTGDSQSVPNNCGGNNQFYQTIGNSTTSRTDVFRFNPFTKAFSVVGQLQGIGNGTATNSAFSSISGYVYSANTLNNIRVYDPLDGYSFVGNISLANNTIRTNQTMFSGDSLLGYVNDDHIIYFDISNITSYPATVNVTQVPV